MFHGKGAGRFVTCDQAFSFSGKNKREEGPPDRKLGGLRRCYNDMGIPLTITLVIWASLSHMTLTIWVRVRVTWGSPYL